VNLLSFFDYKSVRDRAIAHVNADPRRLLALEELSIAHSVGRYEEYISSNSSCLVHMFSSVQAFSGTPWNIEAYDDSLQRDPLLASEVEGQILKSCLQKRPKVHLGCRDNITSILSILSEDVTGYIDACGILKEHTNEQVATDIMTFFKR
jgi:hypothetical protein